MRASTCSSEDSASEIGEVDFLLPVRLEENAVDQIDIDRSPGGSSNRFEHRGWKSACKRDPLPDWNRRANGTHRIGLLMLVSHNEMPAWRRQGCLRWRTTLRFGASCRHVAAW